MNILKKANEIINKRSEEKTRMYGNIHKSMDIAKDIYNSLSGKSITVPDVYLVIISIKLARERFNHKEDNLLDAVAYYGALNDYFNLNKSK